LLRILGIIARFAVRLSTRLVFAAAACNFSACLLLSVAFNIARANRVSHMGTDEFKLLGGAGAAAFAA
jgi:hypothetical protein